MSLKFNKIDTHNLQSTREVIVHNIRNLIFDGTFKRGDRLKENELAKNMGISRTPVREALIQLESEGLVVNVPRRGTIVKGISLKDAIEIYQMREVLEGLASRLACDNITRAQINLLKENLSKMELCIQKNYVDEYIKLHKDFNEIIINASGNRKLINFISQAYDYLMNLRNVTLIDNKRRLKALEEHIQIVKAIEVGDQYMAEKLTKIHIIEAKKCFINRFEQSNK